MAESGSNGSRGETNEAIAIANPFLGLTRLEMKQKIDRFSRISGLPVGDLDIGAFLAKGYRPGTPANGQHVSTDDSDVALVNEADTMVLRLEEEELTYTNFWVKFRAYPRLVFWVVVNCSLGALVQGFDETAVNGAQLFYRNHPGFEDIRDKRTMIGLLTAAPYMVSAVSCLLNEPLNQLFQGRRGVICATCFISFATCLSQGFAQNWKQLLVSRSLLGLGIGPKSATIPIYASECMPAQLRGGLVMMWQMWTAFGIFLGFLFGVVFRDTKDDWRFMLAAPMVPPLIPMLYIFTLPESPRFLLQKAIRAVPLDKEDEPDDSAAKTARKKYILQAWKALKGLYPTKVQASRELMWIYHGLENSRGTGSPDGLGSSQTSKGSTLIKLWTHARTRNALVASAITMFLQQFCGVNIMAYYSSSVLDSLISGVDPFDMKNSTIVPSTTLISISSSSSTDSSGNDAEKWKPLYYSLGFGLLNFVAAFPAVILMDKLGRRRLLLMTFPLMAVCLFAISGLTAIPRNEDDNKARPEVIGGVVAAMYIYCIIYSVGEGPVPFVYASESMPVQHRDAGKFAPMSTCGMGVVTFINWGFNFLLGITWPSFDETFHLRGSFAWYGGWCIAGWFLIFAFVRETKGYRLEQLDRVFAPTTREYIVKYAWPSIVWRYRKLTDKIDNVRPIWPQDKPDSSSIGSTDQELVEYARNRDSVDVSTMGPRI